MTFDRVVALWTVSCVKYKYQRLAEAFAAPFHLIIDALYSLGVIFVTVLKHFIMPDELTEMRAKEAQRSGALAGFEVMWGGLCRRIHTVSGIFKRYNKEIFAITGGKGYEDVICFAPAKQVVESVAWWNACLMHDVNRYTRIGHLVNVWHIRADILVRDDI